MRHSLLAAGFSVLALTAPAWAQTNVERFERQLELIQRDFRQRANPDIPADQRAMLDYGGYLGLSFMAIDDVQQRTHILRQYDLTGYARLNLDNVHEFFLRARTGYRDFNKGDSFDGEGDETTWPTVEQAFYRFDLARYMSAYKGKTTDNNLILQAGRQYTFWANGLVLGQTIDGGLAKLSAGPVELQMLAGVTSHDTVDFDASRPEFDDYTNRFFYGAKLSAQLGKHRPYIYGLIQQDNNDTEPMSIGASTTRFDYNSFYIGIGANGSLGDRLVYGVEAVYEGGDTLSNSFDPSTLTAVDQTRDDIQAAAADFRLDYLFTDARRSRLTLETILATGDHDRLNTSNTFGGNRPNTSDHAFNALGLSNTGLAFAPAVSNIAVFRVGASTFPFTTGNMRHFQVGTDVFCFAKFQEDGPLDEPTRDERFLGWEPDVYVNWQVTSDITFSLRYGVFFPGSAIVSDDNPRNFFFAGLTFAF